MLRGGSFIGDGLCDQLAWVWFRSSRVMRLLGV